MRETLDLIQIMHKM